jgi:threonine synthase
MNKFQLQCRECGATYDDGFIYVCKQCFGPLDVRYAHEKLRVSRDLFASREKSMWRYFELLPLNERSSIVNLHAGFTPLHRCDRLTEKLGLRKLFAKNDALNPTYSFKDRPSGVGVSKALELGLRAVGSASTGNLAASTAAYAARAGLPCYIFMPKGLERSKIVQSLSYGPRIVEVEGTYDDANRLAAEAGETYGIGFVNINLRPFYVEGSKTLAYEVAEQLGWELPDHLIVPVGSGALLNAICKGIEEMNHLGLINSTDIAIHAAQPQGCSPVVDAFKSGSEDVAPVEIPETIAKSLAIGDPGDGIYVVRRLKQFGGRAESVNDAEIIDSIKLLASTEGIFTEPAGGVSVGVLRKLVNEGVIKKDERVVCLVTGNGLKTPEALTGILEQPVTISNNVEDLAPVIGARA